jgi:hypothetical protein
MVYEPRTKDPGEALEAPDDGPPAHAHLDTTEGVGGPQ